jgi:hypothetical protein
MSERGVANSIKAKGIKPIHIGVVAGGAAMIAAAAVIAFHLGASAQPMPDVAVPLSGGRGIVAMPENVDELREKAQQPIEDGYYETRMNVDWVFPSSSKPSENAYVENSENNRRTVYFDLVLADTGELVYSSPFIPIGAKLENFALDAKVPAGDHKGVVTYHLVDDDYQELTTVSVTVTLRIGK